MKVIFDSSVSKVANRSSGRYITILYEQLAGEFSLPGQWEAARDNVAGMVFALGAKNVEVMLPGQVRSDLLSGVGRLCPRDRSLDASRDRVFAVLNEPDERIADWALSQRKLRRDQEDIETIARGYR